MNKSQSIANQMATISSEKSNTFKILIVDDHEIVRQGIYSLFDREDNMTVIGLAESGEKAMGLLKEGSVPDVIVSDFNMSGMTGLELAKKVLKWNSAIRVFILTMQEPYIIEKQAKGIGVSGIISKNSDFNDLLNMITAGNHS